MGFGGLALSVRFAASKVFILSELEGKFGSFGKIRLEKPAATPNEISGAFPNRLFSILTFSPSKQRYITETGSRLLGHRQNSGKIRICGLGRGVNGTLSGALALTEADFGLLGQGCPVG
jgi:hypothetical protein